MIDRLDVTLIDVYGSDRIQAVPKGRVELFSGV
jgi:hypothetical protein